MFDSQSSLINHGTFRDLFFYRDDSLTSKGFTMLNILKTAETEGEFGYPLNRFKTLVTSNC